MAASDTEIFRAVSDPTILGALEVLLEGPASQKEIGAALGVSSAQLSRGMALLVTLGVVHRDRSHGPYRLLDPDGTSDLILAAAQLGVTINRSHLDTSEKRLASLRRKAGRNGGGR